jgi:thioredoxin
VTGRAACRPGEVPNQTTRKSDTVSATTVPIKITDDNFDEEIGPGNGLAMIDFWAEWCGPCRMIAPLMEELAAEYAGQVKVGKLDVDSNPRVAQRFNIRAIPTILYFKDGEHIDTVVGVARKADLEAKIQQHA